MNTREALSHVQGTLGGYKIRCNSEVTMKDNKAFTVLWDAVADLENADRYRWHDLRKDPGDLPYKYGLDWVLVLLQDTIDKRPLLPTVAEYRDGDWHDQDPYNDDLGWEISVIGWKEIEPFEEVEG